MGQERLRALVSEYICAELVRLEGPRTLPSFKGLYWLRCPQPAPSKLRRGVIGLRRQADTVPVVHSNAATPAHNLATADILAIHEESDGRDPVRGNYLRPHASPWPSREVQDCSHVVRVVQGRRAAEPGPEPSPVAGLRPSAWDLDHVFGASLEVKECASLQLENPDGKSCSELPSVRRNPAPCTSSVLSNAILRHICPFQV